MKKRITRLISQSNQVVKALLGMAMLLALPFFVFGQVTVPRAGFPYCQPFTGTTVNPNSLPFTIARGNTVIDYGTGQVSPDEDLILTGNALQLTSTVSNRRGYVLIDLPFSSEYGIKASFEYFIHTPGGNGLGDGIGFFLIDGAITSSTFQIGGVGGSLGYAPHGSDGAGTYSTSGITGGYMGIGFDVLGNHGNYHEKKYGGFHDPNQFNYTSPPLTRQMYPDGITIRGPLNSADVSRRNGSPTADATNIALDSYQFVEGKITYFDPTPGAYSHYGGTEYRVVNGSGNLYVTNPTKFLGMSDMFKIGSGLRPEDLNCSFPLPDGYRKVFINLEPTGNPMSPYLISLDMLVGSNPVPVNIFNGVPYTNKPAPATLKVGFTASTGGGFFSTQEIRNVAVQVSSIEDQAKPLPPSLFREICVEDQQEVELPFCVELPSSSNAFIQCIQLYDTDPGPGDNNFATDTYECGLSGYCAQRCNETFKRLDAIDPVTGNKVGEFIGELSDEVAVGEFNQAVIRYVRTDMSFYGTVTAWYKIVDNFGLESDGVPISITINPVPKIQSIGTKTDVTCDGQGDGSITGVVLTDLAEPGKYQVEFLDDANNVIPFTLVSESQQANGFWTATFDLTGLNLAAYRVRVTNPNVAGLGDQCSDDFDEVPSSDPCDAEFNLHELTQQMGTPVDLQPYEDTICELNDAVVSPSIDPVYNPNGLPVPFKWYADENRSQELVTGSTTIDGAPVDVEVAADGTITITGLLADGTNPKTYSFYVETDFRDNSGSNSGNFCQYDGTVSTVATITVHPAINIQIVETPDWCRENIGTIEVTAIGGTGAKEFYLYEVGNTNPIQQSGAINGTSFTFTGLYPGDYEVEVVTQNPTCTNLLSPITVEGPDIPLALTEVSKSEEFCDLQNGSLTFSLSGGNTPYNSILVGGVDINTLSITQTGDNYLVEDLAGGTYTIEVLDGQNCPISISIDVPYEIPSEFGTIPDEVCEGQTATVQAEIIELSTSAPTFNWFASDGAGGYLPITTSSTFDGGAFTFDAATNSMSVSGLAASATPYTYYLEVTGSKVCDQGFIPVDVIVNFGPEMSPPTLDMVTCFGAGDGVIQAVIPSGNLTDFEFSLSGDNGVNIPFAANNGLFDNLIPGIYSLTMQNAEGCATTIDDLEITEPTEILIQTTDKIEPTCGEANGTWTFVVSGGTPDGSGSYEISLDGSPVSSLGADWMVNGTNDFTVLNLSPGDHVITVQDANSCPMDFTETFTAQAIPVFDVADVTICENEASATLSPIIVDQAGSTPAFTWSYEDPSNPGTYIDIANNDNINGATHTLVGNDLQIAGLLNSGSPYTYYLKVSGDLVCPADPIPAVVTVLKLPEVVFEQDSVSCFGGNDGGINLISSDPSANMTYSVMETGASNATGNFTGLAAGIYTITAQENGAPCSNQFTVEVLQPSELQLLNESQIDPTCGDDNGSISFDLVGGTPDYQVTVNGTPIEDFPVNSKTGDTYEVKNLAPGTYSVAMVDANGCILTRDDLFSLVNDAGIDVSINPIAEEICEGQDVLLELVFQSPPPTTPTLKWFKDSGLSEPITSSPDPDVDGLTYQIVNGNLTVSGLLAGSHDFYLEISGAGICTSVEQAGVEVYPELTATIDLTDETCFQAEDGSITVNGVGGNGIYEYSLNGAAFSATNAWTDLPQGTYSISVRNDIGCTYSEDVTIGGPTSAISINSPTIIRSSCDLDNGSIEDLVISGGTPAYSVEWRKGSATGTVVAGDENGAMDLAPDTYYLLVTDASNCTEVFDFLVEESSDPVYAIIPPIDACIGTPVEIRPVHIAPDPSLPPAAATEVRWFAGPGQTDEIQNGPDPSNPSISYTIDDSDWLNPELIVEGLPAGTYDYYFYVVCTGQEIQIDITVYDTPQVVLDTEAITCFGDTDGKAMVLSGGMATYTYSLDGGASMDQSNFEALNLAAGSYQLIISTPAGCAQTIDFEIEGPDDPLASSPLTKIDPGCGASNGKLELTVTGGWVPYTLEVIKDGTLLESQTVSENDISLNGYSIGDYQIIITDAGGCFVTTNTVTLVDGPTQILIEEDEICVGAIATLTPVLDPVAPGATFQWYFDSSLSQPITSSASPAADGNIYQINSTTGELTISNLPESATPYIYYVTASGSSVCPGFVGEAEVRVFGTPSATAIVDNEVCFGDGGQITVNATGGSGNYTYSLNGAGFVTDNVFDVATGTYQVEVMTAEGCSFVLSDIQVTGPSAALEVSAVESDSPTCDQDNGEIRFTVSGGYEPYVISYTRNGIDQGTVPLPNTGQISIPGLGEGEYEFQIEDGEGCLIALPNPIELVEVPTVITAPDDSICEGETAQITPSLPQNITNPAFSWSFDAAGNNPISNGTSNGVTYTIASNGVLSIQGLTADNSPTTYYVTASGNGICNIVPEEVEVSVYEIPILRVSNPSVVCDPGGTVDLTDYIEGFNPSIYDYNVLSPSGTAMRLDELDHVAISGDYRVSSSAKGSDCWNQPQRIRVLIAETLLEAEFQFEVDLGDGTLITNGDIQIQEDVQFEDLSLGDAVIWNWDFGDGSTSSEQHPIHQYQSKGIYTVSLQVIDSIGCVSTFEMVVQVFDDYMVMFPNAFTPDGVKNQNFRPQHRGIAQMEVFIFNTWGELIYHADTLEDQGWDGTVKGTSAPNGNYVYRAKFTSRSGEKFEKSGVFILIR